MERFRASSLFQPANFVAAIESRHDAELDERPEHLFGAYLTIPHTQVARIMAVLGFDFIFVDTLHVPTDPEKLVDIIQTINFASAAGIIFPQIETAAEARAAAKKVRYAYSGGDRSVSPVALLDGITNIAPPGWTAETVADRNIAVICQIESVLGIENAHAIAKTPGVNGLMIGSGDLRASLGLPCRNPPGHREHPSFYAASAKLVAAAKSCGIPLMAPAFRADPDDIAWLRDFKMLITSVDTLSIVKSHRQDLAAMRDKMIGCEHYHTNGF
uniref:HpcH/HpaI aldolase/citrate lyase domain-containing protein n=1 Tax=Bionectria ochroleuca TaxID=29856 RepID=A0A0B7JT47_BIOOC